MNNYLFKCCRSALVLIISILVLPVQAQVVGHPVPKMLNLQGVMRNIAGEPVNGTYDLTVTLFRTQDVQSRQCSDTIGSQIYKPSIHVIGGVFSLELGLPGNVFEGETAAYFEVGVWQSGEYWIVSPCSPLASVAFALQAEHAEVADEATHALNADTLNLLSSASFVQIPPTCSVGQVPKRFSGGWECATPWWVTPPNCVGDRSVLQYNGSNFVCVTL